MSPRKLLGLTAIVLLLLGFIVFFERKMPSTSERQEKGDLVWELPQERIESLRLEHGASVVELRKGEGAGWRIVKPEAYAADAGAVNDVTSQLARLRREGSDAVEAGPEAYGLQSPSAKATVVWKAPGDDKKRLSRTIEFGIDIPGTDAVAARVTGSDKVVSVPASVAAAVKKNADDFKSKEVFGGSTADVTRLEVERGRGGRLSLAKKDGGWWLTQPLADLADTEAIQRFVGELTGLKALEFLPGPERQSLASLGLAPPFFRVTLAGPKGAAATVDFGSTRSDLNSVYARRETQVFTVPSSITEELSREAEAFREVRLVRFDRARLASVSGAFGQRTFSLERQASGWSASGKAVPAAGVDDLLSAISEAKSRSFIDEGEAASWKGRDPKATVTLRAPGEDWTIQLYAFRGETRATVSGRPGAFALSSDPTESLQSAFQKAATPLPPTPGKAPTPKK
jgi:hypothetical protein